MTNRVGLIILAAGESSRFGSPKQLSYFEGKTLIQRAVDTAAASHCRPIVVVLGADSSAIAPGINGSVTIVENPKWRTGMASSIHCGLLAIEDQVDAVIISVSDQPMITSNRLNQFVEASNHGLVAAEYAKTVGVPALFKREFFPSLHALHSQSGAKQILLQNQERLVKISCPEAAIDIDTAEDLLRLGSLTRTSQDREGSS